MCKWESLCEEKQVLLLFLKDFCHLCKWIWGLGCICDLLVLRLFAWGIESKEKSPLAHDSPSPLITFNDDQRGGYCSLWYGEWSECCTMASEENEKEEIGERLYDVIEFSFTKCKTMGSRRKIPLFFVCRPLGKEKRKLTVEFTFQSPQISSLSVLPFFFFADFSWESQPPEEFFRLFQKESSIGNSNWRFWPKLLVGPPSFDSLHSWH